MVDVPRILKRYASLKASRDGYWTDIWKEARFFVYPNERTELSEGGRRMEIFDVTAIECRQKLAAGMQMYTAPATNRWFSLVMTDEKGQVADGKNSAFFSQLTEIVSLGLANSNWSGILTEALNEAVISDAVIGVDFDEKLMMPVFTRFPIESVCYALSEKKKLDTIYIDVKLTPLQALERFGEKGLPDELRSDAFKPEKCDIEQSFVRCVMPNERADATKENDHERFAFMDVYIHERTKKVVYSHGVREMPFAVLSFAKSSHEHYGRGPGIDYLPIIKALNLMVQCFMRNLNFEACPAWLVPDNSIVGNFDDSPGKIIKYKPNAGNSMPQQLIRNVNVSAEYQSIVAEREVLKKMFFMETFDPLGDLKNITATEAEIREGGKLIPFAPIASNIHLFYKAIIERVVALYIRSGVIQVPEELASADYKIDFQNKIAMSLKKIQTLGWTQTEGFISNIVSVDPTVMDNFNRDKIVRDIATVNGINPEWVHDADDVAKSREARAQAEEQAAQSAQLQQMAAAPSLTKAPEAGSIMANMMGGM